ncbi:hypothetical protein [Xanthomonas medicagonis]|uniref:hypothetical protein n=1 Tax=Xanthomonas medicagonis TaxID=3160841 RepID=UPI003511537E
MKVVKWIPVALSFALFLFIALISSGGEQERYDAADYLRYMVFFPGITLCLYLAFSLYPARTWSQFFIAVFLCLPALIAVHYVVSVINAHTRGAYWWWQLLEIALTYLAWAKTGKRWSRGSRSLPPVRSKHGAS